MNSPGSSCFSVVCALLTVGGCVQQPADAPPAAPRAWATGPQAAAPPTPSRRALDMTSQLAASGRGFQADTGLRLSMTASYADERTFAVPGASGIEVTLQPRAAAATGRLVAGRVLFADVARATDARVVAGTDFAGELVTLRAPDAPLVHRWQLRAGSGVARIEREQGTGALLFQDRQGATRLRLPHPEARDAADRAVAVGFSLADGMLTLSLRPPADVRYPLVLAVGMENPQWKQLASSSQPDRRTQHAVVFDEGRNALVVFGGVVWSGGSVLPRQDIWEWSVATGKWTDRTPMGGKPEPRWGAAVAYDKDRGKVVLFGGRAASGFDFEDTWEWDGATATWADRSAAGTKPRGRTGHAMTYDRAARRTLLFGGGVGNADIEFQPGVGLADTWEWDGATATWRKRETTSSPTARHSHELVFDGNRNRVVLFGGLERLDAASAGTPKQDTWEWDAAAGGWTERTAVGPKPTPRYGHAMAFDPARNRVVLWSGHDISAAEQPSTRDDLWEWDPTAGAWTERRASGDRPGGKLFAGVGWDPVRKVVLLHAGTEGAYRVSGDAGVVTTPFVGQGTRELWEWDGAAGAFVDRGAGGNSPLERQGHALGHDPLTGRTVLFGGASPEGGGMLDDTWELDGKTGIWTQRKPGIRPAARMNAAMAWDPARKTVLLVGGVNFEKGPQGIVLDTWEWNSAAGTWAQVTTATATGPQARERHAMTTDTTRGKVILFGGYSPFGRPIPIPGPDGGLIYTPFLNDVWEWDGATRTWTDRTPPAGASAPFPRDGARIAYDAARRRVVMAGGIVQQFGRGPIASSGALAETWEWDPETSAWAERKPATSPGLRTGHVLVYDSVRHRVVMFGGGNFNAGMQATSDTWEYDGSTWVQRTTTTAPSPRQSTVATFEPGRGALVLFGGEANGAGLGDTWEYNVTNLSDGSGCTVELAARCSTGFCVDGACCEVASCSGPCKSCNAAGMPGKCVLARAGTQVSGSCSGAQACDGAGTCKAANGQACVSATECASTFCADGVCCDGACSGACASCNQPGKAGLCSAFARGSDPDRECPGSGLACGGSCDGVSGCAYPSTSGTCGTCDGMGTCREPAMCAPDGGLFPPPIGRDAGTPSRDAPRAVDVGQIAVDGGRTDGPQPSIDGGPVRDGGQPDTTPVDTAPVALDGQLPDSGSSAPDVARDLTSPAPDAGLADGSSRLDGSGDASVVKSGSSGCGCEVGRARTGEGGASVAMALLAAVLLRRRRRRG